MRSVDIRPASVPTRAVALLLPGGRADSLEPTPDHHLAGVRMRPFASSLHRRGAADGLEVWSLRYEVRGWNAELMSPVADARWALAEVRHRRGDVPVVLVGHSMGGRTAMRVADDGSVVAAVGLAPWLPDGEPVSALADRHVLVAHGTGDRVTSPRASLRFVDRARGIGVAADFVSVRGETHAMLVRARAWHRLTTAWVLDVLGVAPMPPRLRDAVASGAL